MISRNNENRHGSMSLQGRELTLGIPAPETGSHPRNRDLTSGINTPDRVINTVGQQATREDSRPLIEAMSPRVIRRIKSAEGVRYLGQR